LRHRTPADSSGDVAGLDPDFLFILSQVYNRFRFGHAGDHSAGDEVGLRTIRIRPVDVDDVSTREAVVRAAIQLDQIQSIVRLLHPSFEIVSAERSCASRSARSAGAGSWKPKLRAEHESFH